MKLTEAQLRETIQEVIKEDGINEAKGEEAKAIYKEFTDLVKEYRKKIKAKVLQTGRGSHSLNFGIESFSHHILPQTTVYFVDESIFGDDSHEIEKVSFSSSNMESKKDLDVFITLLKEIQNNWELMEEYKEKEKEIQARLDDLRTKK